MIIKRTDISVRDRAVLIDKPNKIYERANNKPVDNSKTG